MEKISPIHLPDTEEGALCPHSLQGSLGKRVLMEKPAKLPLFSCRPIPEPPCCLAQPSNRLGVHNFWSKALARTGTPCPESATTSEIPENSFNSVLRLGQLL